MMEELLTDDELEEMRLAALAEDERARAPPAERPPPRHAPATPPPPARPPAPPGFDVDQLFADSDDALGLARPAPTCACSMVCRCWLAGWSTRPPRRPASGVLCSQRGFFFFFFFF